MACGQFRHLPFAGHLFPHPFFFGVFVKGRAEFGLAKFSTIHLLVRSLLKPSTSSTSPGQLVRRPLALPSGVAKGIGGSTRPPRLMGRLGLSSDLVLDFLPFCEVTLQFSC